MLRLCLDMIFCMVGSRRFLLSHKKEKKEKKFTIICAIYWRDTTLRWSAGSWISYIPIVQLVNDRVGRWSVYVCVSIRHLNSGHYVCGHRCVPNATDFFLGFRSHNTANFDDFIVFMYFFYRRRLRNKQNFKKRTCWARRPLNLFSLPSHRCRRRRGLETFNKSATETKQNKRYNEQSNSRTIAMECRVRETKASGRERIMIIAVNHALSSN